MFFINHEIEPYWCAGNHLKWMMGLELAGEKAACEFLCPGQGCIMTRKQIESAVANGIPFTLRMADGKEYPVPHRDHISLPPNASYVIVYDDEGHFTVLPLLTMTGLESKVTEAGTKEK